MPSERIQRQIDRLLDQADQAFGEIDYEALQKFAEAILRVGPENSDALTYLDASKRDMSTAGSPQSTAVVPPSSQTDVTTALDAESPSQPGAWNSPTAEASSIGTSNQATCGSRQTAQPR